MQNTDSHPENSSRREWLKKSSLIGSAVMTGELPFIEQPQAKMKKVSRRLPISVSTFSYWHFKEIKYPIEKVIEDAGRLGFDGVEILHRQMTNESVSYQNKLKRMAFDGGLSLPLLSIQQSFVNPDEAKRKADVAHTKRCINIATQMGIPCVRMNTGSWGTVKRDAEYFKTGIEKPIEGYTDEDAIKWCIDEMHECLRYAEKAGVVLAIENHWGLSSNIDILIRIYKELAGSPSMGMNVDTGNFVGEPYAQLEKLAPYATIVQAKTYYGGGENYDKDLDYKRIGIYYKKPITTDISLWKWREKKTPQQQSPKAWKCSGKLSLLLLRAIGFISIDKKSICTKYEVRVEGLYFSYLHKPNPHGVAN